ncbi:hypothetical protein DICPUDRAFT_86804 [Dictyostelium purpureum]|uniref:Uncharacterized protein n=1 Tax=Dictyostelium purpureum TaxID=5786 RepID=F0ZDZ6_DICPU|nr:uncharacterized protein DICPUDRAFT_86804 [Dictyostelium purpureum]EGC37792.1 hypothetical protein DICPUDRAFT_86804 [Dictyostelium purpureum]|eukprot:XP_003285637.1 hypothetical protein DICPUDRAFT_86804 [Dictyostelium purpureum]
MKSKIIKSFNDIELLDSINGINIDIIENRAKAIQDNTSDKESWRYRSFDGFLGENETFKERLEKDWNLLENWNKENNFTINHMTLSTILKEIINQCEQNRNDLGFDNNDDIELYITKNIFNGFQYSLFWNESSKKEKSFWNTKWNVEYNVVNVKTQKQIIISGDSNAGIIQYIEYLGFYEGDENNQYRINPINLILLLLNK